MTRWMMCCIMLATAVAAPVSAKNPSPWKDFYGDVRSPAIPKAVRKFVIDAQGCTHFSGEEGYDAERAAYLKKMTDKMCTGIEKRYEKLLTRYRGNVEVTAIIAEVWEPFA
jgi:hypothetical protein